MFVKALKSPRHPILAHLVPIRRCNLSCTYCNEFDKVSDPVPTEEVFERIDQLARLGTTMVHLSGGEPMLHPDLSGIIRRIRSRDMLAGLLTNGLLLSRKRIRELNEAGLDHLQISIDNVQPTDVSKKSLRVLDKKLRNLAEFAEFEVSINSVLGNDLDPEESLTIARRAAQLGFGGTVGIIHDHDGQLEPLSRRHRRIYEQIKRLKKRIFRSASHNPFQENLIRGRPNQWHCRAGSRYLYICEEGLVHYCSQQRGTPGIPLSRYGVEDLDREYESVKGCAPFCTVSCVHRVAWVDRLRTQPLGALEEFFPAAEGQPWSRRRLPVPVRVLAWLFLPDPDRRRPRLLARAAVRILGLSGREAGSR